MTREKKKKYVLIKNDGVEGEWALGVVSNKEGEWNKSIDVEGLKKEDQVDDKDEAWEDDGFEDIPIEGLNRLLKRLTRSVDIGNHDAPFESEEIKKRRRALYEARMEAAGVKRAVADPNPAEEQLDSLFIPQIYDEIPKNDDEGVDDLFKDVLSASQDEDDDL